MLFLLWRIEAVRRRPGLLIGAFLIGYAVFRSFAELFREPDAHLGFIFAHITMGQLLCVPMLLLGVWFVVRALRRSRAPA